MVSEYNIFLRMSTNEPVFVDVVDIVVVVVVVENLISVNPEDFYHLPFSGEKFVGEKWRNFYFLTKYLTDEIF